MVKGVSKAIDLREIYRNYEEMKEVLLTRVCFEIEDSGKPITFIIDPKRKSVFYSTLDFTPNMSEYIFLYRFDSSRINTLPVSYYFNGQESYSILAAAESAMKDKTFSTWISRRTGKGYTYIRRKAIKKYIAEELDNAFFEIWKNS